MKRLFLFALIGALCFVFVACGDSKEHIGEAKTPSASSVMAGQSYDRVVNAFEEKGFTNIRVEKIEDLVFGFLTGDGEVEDVSVGGSVDYSPDEWVSADIEVIIRYHTFPESEHSDLEPGSLSPNDDVGDNGNTNDGEESSEQTKPLLEYKDGYLLANYDYLSEPLPGTDPKDVYLAGEITQVNDWLIVVTDAANHTWTVDLGTDRDFSGYMGTNCEVYGGCVGGISSQYNTPLIFLDGNDNYHCVFSDGTEFFPNSYDSVQQLPRRDLGDTNSGDGRVVWIPTDGGTKYHSTSTCSNMLNPEQVSESDAINRGFSQCGKCW